MAQRSLIIAWLLHMFISMLIALVAGALAFVIARGATSAVLFIQQQQFFSAAASVMRGGIAGLGGSNLRDLRRLVEQLDWQYETLSLAIGFAVAGVTAVASYIWQERRAARARHRVGEQVAARSE